jgi:nucleoside-diphosphate-sugar epimerase
MTKEKRILVTGGAGFIGTHLVNALAMRSEAKLEIVDDLSSSSISQDRFDFFNRKGILFRHSTVEDFRIPTDVRYRQIYHLACRVGPARVTQYSGCMGSEIVSDAMKMANLAIRDEAPLISISTSEVYGKDPNGRPQHEGLPMEVPAETSARLEYTVAKLLTEISLLNMATVNPSLRVNLIRPFNIVGPYQTAEGGFVLPRFVEAALQGKPITVFGDGTQVRAFTHVSDLVESLLLVMGSDVNRKIYNIGTPENTCSIGTLASRVVNLLGSTSEIRNVDPQTIFGQAYTDAPSKVPDINLINRDLGWWPRWSLDEIIKDYGEFVIAENQVAKQWAVA